MKTSNAIFLSFLIFLFGGIILLCLGSKYYKGYNDGGNIVKQEKALPTFSVIVAESGASFSLKSGKINKIILARKKDAVSQFAPFVVRNDTLFISSAKHIQVKENQYWIDSEVFCINVKSIVAKEKSYINIPEFQTDTLNISMKNSKLDWFGLEKVAFVSVEAKDSNIYLDGEKIEKIVVKLDKTQLSIPVKKRIDNLSGSLKNGSKCDFSISNNLNLTADQTSKYGLFGLFQ